MQAGRQVAVVGCGVAGLVAIKSCLEEGLEPTCFEMRSDIGGLWYPADEQYINLGPGMYDSLITNTSKAMMCFSDFPCPAHYPPYLPHRLYLQYLHIYTDHFHLREHIHFNTKVVNVHKHDDYSKNGRWVVVKETKTNSGETKQEGLEFDCVMLCQGFYRIPRSPKIAGMDSFVGGVIHAQKYRRPEPYRNKTVLVFGNAASAGDISVDIASVAKQVYLCIGDGALNISRLHNGRTPLDFRIRRALFYSVPSWLAMRAVLHSVRKWLDPVCSGLDPNPSRPLAQIHLVINDQLPFKIITGQVKVVGHVKSLEHDKAHLEDGTTLHDLDEIVFATGYEHDFHAVDSSVISPDPDGEKLELFKMAFPLSQEHDTLALIGCLRANGPIPPILESQARLAARVMAGRHKLPDQATMKRDVDHMNKKLLERHGRYNYSFHYLLMCDDICTELGAQPVWWRLLLRGDLQMALAVLFGPAHPFHYRLMGPGAWGGARQATLRAYNETVFSIQHRRVDKSVSRMSATRFPKVFLQICILVAAVFVAFWHCGY
ncbi:hypothetical protein BaRGS_00027243 [Batillaria attramentaria]|uniref:Flavin-containing monooxygenase n=1 Tax=Batillaria attramentaria TaxID=370345 RepID=A0ABD0K389_9CAEN